MCPLNIRIFWTPLPSRTPVPEGLASVDEMVKPFKSSVTPLALTVMALPLVTLRFFVK